MSAYPDTASFLEIDRELGLPKGSAFRAFKRIETSLVEGRDYTLLWAHEDHEAISVLRSQGRVYPTSRNIVLLAPQARERVIAALREAGGGASQPK